MIILIAPLHQNQFLLAVGEKDEKDGRYAAAIERGQIKTSAPQPIASGRGDRRHPAPSRRIMRHRYKKGHRQKKRPEV